MSLRDLQLKLALTMADRLSGPAKRATLVNKKLSAGIKNTRANIAQANQQAKKVEYLQNLGGKVNQSAEKLSQAREKVARLRRELNRAKETGKPVATLTRQLNAAGRSVGRLSRKHTELRTKTKQVRSELKAAGINTGKLSQAKEQLIKRTERLNKKLAQQQSLLKKSAKAGEYLSGTFSKLKTTASWILGGALASSIALGGPLLSTASTFEGYEAILETVEGSQAKAKASMKWVSDFAASTPNELGDVTEAFVRLRANGLDPTNGLLKTLGDTSAAMGKPIMQAVEAIADAVTGENERLKEFGIKASVDKDIVSYDFTDSKGVQRTMSALKSDRKQVEALLTKIWAEKYGGASERQAKTWKGLMSNLGDQWTRFQVMVMNSGPFEKLKGHLGGLLDRLNAMAESGQLQEWAELVGKKIMLFIDAMVAAGSKLGEFYNLVMSIASPLADFVGGWGNLAVAVASIKFVPILTSLGALGKIATAHPILALITLLAAGALAIITNWDKITAWALPYWESLKAMFFGAGQAISDYFYNWTPLGLIIKHWDSIKAYFVSLPEQFSAFGRNIINALGAGIDEKFQAIKNKLTGLSDYLPDWLKDKIGINGEVKSVPSVTQKTPGVLPSVMAANIAATGISAAPALAAPSGGAGNTQITQSITVQPAPGMNEQDLAQKVAQEVSKLNQKQAARERSKIHDEV